MTFAGRLRNLWRAWRLQHWDARNSYPSRLRRKYDSEAERNRDAARLTAHGYRVVDEEDTHGSVNVEPAATWFDRRLPGSIEVDLPLAAVTYERDPERSAP
ncbi:MAG: hypothetical protein ACLQT7_07345 [Candidatus Dormibacteria bacterium]